MFYIYTDGACKNNGKPYAKSAYAFYCATTKEKRAGKGNYLQKNTNNTAELKAIHKALIFARSRKIKNVCIKTDSQYCIGSLKKWKLTPKKHNYQQISEILEIMKEFNNLKIEFVPAHCGIYGNEMADTLATQHLSKIST